MNAIRVYAYARSDGRKNFGDDMSPAIVGHVTGLPFQAVAWDRAQVIAIGSILHHVLRKKAVLKIGLRSLMRRRPVVWGSGLLGPMLPSTTKHIRFLSVRGPLTAQSLGLSVHNFGDAGILAREMVDAAPKTHRLGIIPHYTEANLPAVQALAAEVAHSTIISVQQDWPEVLRQLSACEAVVSSSLHGLIVADSYRIPNARVTFAESSSLADFKFRDYAASLGRPDGCALAGNPMNAAQSVMDSAFRYDDAVDRLCSFVRSTGVRIPDYL